MYNNKKNGGVLIRGKSYRLFVLFSCCFTFVATLCFEHVAFAEPATTSTEEETTLNSPPINQWMPDENLQTVIADSLNKPVALVTQEDMLSLTVIFALGQNVSSLEGLQYAKNLTYINFYNNHISDLTPISQLTSLTILWFGYNNISDISMIQGLTNVSQINFDDNHISDLSPIADFPNLFHLTAQRQEVTLPAITIHTKMIDLLFEIKWGIETARYVYPEVNGFFNKETNNIEWTNLDTSGVLEYSWRFDGLGPFYGTARRAYTFIPLEAGTVTVRYLDRLGNSIHPNVTLKGNIGETFISEQKLITGFTFQEIQGNPTGTFTEQAQEVTYIYAKDPIPAADVTVHYLDPSGNSIHPDILLTGNIGERYTSEQKEIEGYLFNKVIGDPTGEFTDQPQTITYLYDPKKITTEEPTTESGTTTTPDITDKTSDNDKDNDHKHHSPKKLQVWEKGRNQR